MMVLYSHCQVKTGRRFDMFKLHAHGEAEWQKKSEVPYLKLATEPWGIMVEHLLSISEHI